MLGIPSKGGVMGACQSISRGRVLHRGPEERFPGNQLPGAGPSRTAAWLIRSRESGRGCVQHPRPVHGRRRGEGPHRSPGRLPGVGRRMAWLWGPPRRFSPRAHTLVNLRVSHSTGGAWLPPPPSGGWGAGVRRLPGIPEGNGRPPSITARERVPPRIVSCGETGGGEDTFWGSPREATGMYRLPEPDGGGAPPQGPDQPLDLHGAIQVGQPEEEQLQEHPGECAVLRSDPPLSSSRRQGEHPHTGPRGRRLPNRARNSRSHRLGERRGENRGIEAQLKERPEGKSHQPPGWTTLQPRSVPHYVPGAPRHRKGKISSVRSTVPEQLHHLDVALILSTRPSNPDGWTPRIPRLR